MASLTHAIRTVPFEITVVVTKELRLRVWFATKLVKLAAWIIGGRSEVEVEQ